MTGKSHPYPRLARLTLAEHLAGRRPAEDLPGRAADDESLWSPRAGCFVSLKKGGDLRGCIGTIFPVQENLGLEIMHNAVSAATRDPRFPPVRLAELEGLRLSVDVLSPPEPVADPAQLDPARWGVIVEKNGRRGLLLPDLEGVDTVEAQLAIATRKAGISDLNGLTVHRFSVERFGEGEGG